MIQKLNYFFTWLFDMILYPFSFLNEFWGILFISVLMGFVVLYGYKWISSPGAVKAAKNQIKANILAIRLYKDLWQVIVVSFFKSLAYTFKYFFLNFGPLILILPVLFPAAVQMELRYGSKSFDVGDTLMIKASFVSSPHDLDIQLMDSDYFKTTMNPVVIDAVVRDDLHDLVTDDLDSDSENVKKISIKEVNWKVEALKTGAAVIKIKVGDKIFEKSLVIGASRDAMSNKRMKTSSLSHFLYPVESLLPGGGEVNHIQISYPGKEISFAGITMHWLWYNLILMVIIVVAFMKKFGIEF
ncbi:MAG: hypothetical protein GY940_20855 [bacterium]|nr:hypothetical protein [bacterium]